jgi:hypothetical protein
VKYNIDPNKGTGTNWIKKVRHIARRAFFVACIKSGVTNGTPINAANK